jgi:methionyl-tRNA formyltransferase
MRMVKALDAGPVILQVRTPIPDDETFGELQLRLAEMGALALIEALALIGIGRETETPQNDDEATYAPKIDRSMTRVNWTADARVVARTIRAFDPKPGAFTQSNAADVKVFGARVASSNGGAARGAPGEVLTIDDRGRTVACGDGSIRIANVQPAGKRRIAPVEWLRGRGIAVGQRLS